MQKSIFAIGWGAAIILLIATVYLLLSLQQSQAAYHAKIQENETLKAQLERMIHLAKSATPAEVDIDPFADEPDATTKVASLPDAFNLDKVVGDMIQDMAVETEAAANTDQAFDESEDNIGERSDWDRRRGDWQGRFMEMRYQDLFKELNLSPERAEELGAILQKNQERRHDIRQLLREGLLTPEEAEAKLQAIDQEFYSRLESTLSPQEIAQYEHYEDTAPERMMTHSLDRQMSEYSGISNRLRNQISSTFQQELLNEPIAADGGIPIDPFTRSNEAYIRTLEQLNGQISPADYAQAQAFFEERMRMQSAMIERMSTWGMGRGSGGRRGPSGGGRPPF